MTSSESLSLSPPPVAGSNPDLGCLTIWRDVFAATVRRNGPDLSARQLAVLLQVYLSEPPHTVRGLSSTLNVSKPAITRALDRLGYHGYIRRRRDPQDRRNVLVQRTIKGSVYLSEFAEMINHHADVRWTSRQQNS